MRNKPSRIHLEKAVEDICYLMTHCFCYFLWVVDMKPKLGTPEKGKAFSHLAIENSIVEANLMYFRKLGEFFNPPNKNDRDDDLRAYDYGFTDLGSFIKPCDATEIHKRGGHPTTRQAQFGKASWEMLNLLIPAMSKSFMFCEFLTSVFFKENQDRIDYVKANESILTSLSARLLDFKKKEEKKLRGSA